LDPGLRSAEENHKGGGDHTMAIGTKKKRSKGVRGPVKKAWERKKDFEGKGSLRGGGDQRGDRDQNLNLWVGKMDWGRTGKSAPEL